MNEEKPEANKKPRAMCVTLPRDVVAAIGKINEATGIPTSRIRAILQVGFNSWVSAINIAEMVKDESFSDLIAKR